jgi:hypothetical protein
MTALFEAVQNQTSGHWSLDADTAVNVNTGSIQGPKVGVMVVRQTEPVLQQIEQLLTNYRAALLQSKPRKQERESPEDVIVRYYRLSSPVAEDLQKALLQLVDPKSWKSDQNPEGKGEILMKIASAPGFQSMMNQFGAGQPEGQASGTVAAGLSYSVLIIRHERQMHDKIWEVITRVQNGDPNFGEGMGGMGGMGGGGFGGSFFRIPPLPTQKLPGTREK